MEILRDNEEKIICPYNPAHYIRKCRMDVHLKKCRKAYPESEAFGICDFNASHRVPKPELQYHHNNCPSRKNIELHVFSEEVTDDALAPPLWVPAPSVPADDSWDNVEVATYDPQKYCESNPILRRIDTESAATRRNFRIAERQRFGNFDSFKSTQPIATTSDRRPKPVKLPPTPAFDNKKTVEPTPDSILKILDRTTILPKKAFVPTTKKN